MKKTVSIILAVLLIISVIPVFAFAQEDRPGTDYPLIILPGINHSVSYLANDDGTPYINGDGKEISGGIMLIDTEGIYGKLIKKLLAPLLASLVLQCDAGLSDAAYDLVCDLFSIQACDKNGNQLNNLVTIEYDYPVSEMDNSTKNWFYSMIPIRNVTEKIGEENVYLCTFPLVGDPMASAEHLRDFIQMVKEQRNVDKVDIATVSLGGTILTAYADIIDGDWSDVHQIINVVSCLNGTDLFADFFDREWNLDAEYLYKDYIRQIFKQNEGRETLGCVINMALRLLSKDTVYSLLTGAFSGVLDTFLLNDPQFWATLPRERYDALAERYLSTEDYSVLRAKTDRFQQARINLEKNLTGASSQGVSVNSICGCDLTFNDGDYNFLGIVKSTATCNSDGIVPVYSTSIGATTVPAGTTFSDDYLAGADSKYISDFKSVDASTCLFPDNVWFFQKQHHEVGRNDAVMELLCRIATGAITDINSDPQFPQFMGTRNTREFIRWLIPEAKDVMENTDGIYTEEQGAAVKKAYDEAMEVLSDYSITDDDREVIDRVEKNLKDALVAAGRRQAEESKPEYFDDATEKVLTKTDDAVFRIYKDNGYFDFLGYGKVNGYILRGLRSVFG